ncbi:MAG: outer membrane efflux protein [Bacteroidetes bacterium OLB11]|nr:MAG: outer membrane efflux protein [Bacteroidetes bacterium OLB11]
MSKKGKIDSFFKTKSKQKKSEIISTPKVVEQKTIIKNHPIKTESTISKKSETGEQVVVQPSNRNSLDLSRKEIWTLSECIQYAKDNHLQIAEVELNKRFEELLLEENRNMQYPDLNGDLFAGKSFGRNIDPVTNAFTTKKFNYSLLDFNSKTLLFGWFQKKYENDQMKFNIAASSAQKEQLENDVALNITVGFIRVIQAREMSKIFQNKIQATLAQLNSVSYQMKKYLNATLANDSLQYVESKHKEHISLLELKSLMNLTSNQKFDIQTNQSEIEWFKNVQQISDIQSYTQEALNKNSLVQYNEYKLMSSQKILDIAKAKQYPTLSLYGNLGTVYSSTVRKITSQNYEGESPIGYVNINGTSYPLTQSEYSYSYQTQSLLNQFSNHIRAGVALGLNIPLLNGYQERSNMQKAKINLVHDQMILDRQKQKLSQDVLLTYESVKSLQKEYLASQNAKRKNETIINEIHQNTISSPIEYLEWNQMADHFIKARLVENEKKYQLLFKLKTLDYLLSNPLNL